MAFTTPLSAREPTHVMAFTPLASRLRRGQRNEGKSIGVVENKPMNLVTINLEYDRIEGFICDNLFGRSPEWGVEYKFGFCSAV